LHDQEDEIKLLKQRLNDAEELLRYITATYVPSKKRKRVDVSDSLHNETNNIIEDINDTAKKLHDQEDEIKLLKQRLNDAEYIHSLSFL